MDEERNGEFEVDPDPADCYEIPAAAGKTIRVMRGYRDPEFGREVVVSFTDGTEISVEIETRMTVSAKHYRPGVGELEILSQQDDL